MRDEVDAAIAEGASHVSYQGDQIPATLEVREKLASVVAAEAPEPTPEDETSDSRGGDADADAEERPDRTVVIVHENFVEESWAPQGSPRKAPGAEVPDAVRTTLLDHQHEALAWQVEGWCAGHPGLLNADDQGLGKTLQTLAFLAWLKAWMSEAPDDERRPVLVVAPTGLLRTWQAEEQTHLAGTGLGARIDAYGPGLRELRVSGLAGRDTDDGAPRLSFEALQSSIEQGQGHDWWVLTTYETLASYQHSFRSVHFSVAVFDEIQKIKNVKTLMALAARGVRADFRIGLTGTPLQNHVVDLWAVMDAVVPGRLHTLKHFLDHYGAVTEDKMRELHSRLFLPIETPDNKRYPPVGQRRLKEDVLVGLPRKDFRVYPATMPSVQAQAYELARRHLADGARGAALKLLHHIRGVSLHPEPPDTVQDDLQTYFARSARFDSFRRILGRIHARGERALIFTEHRRMQAFPEVRPPPIPVLAERPAIPMGCVPRASLGSFVPQRGSLGPWGCWRRVVVTGRCGPAGSGVRNLRFRGAGSPCLAGPRLSRRFRLGLVGFGRLSPSLSLCSPESSVTVPAPVPGAQNRWIRLSSHCSLRRPVLGPCARGPRADCGSSPPGLDDGARYRYLRYRRAGTVGKGGSRGPHGAGPGSLVATGERRPRRTQRCVPSLASRGGSVQAHLRIGKRW